MRPSRDPRSADFRRFEKVTAANGRLGDHFAGRCGTVIWYAPHGFDGGVAGVQFEVPRRVRIDHDFIVGAMSAVFGAEAWAVVRGPDSLALK